MAHVRVAWVRHRGTPQSQACLLDVTTWRSMCGVDWSMLAHGQRRTYYEPVQVSEPATIGMTTGRPGDNACSRCIERSWRLAVAGELEITTLLDTQPPLPMMEVGT